MQQHTTHTENATRNMKPNGDTMCCRIPTRLSESGWKTQNGWRNYGRCVCVCVCVGVCVGEGRGGEGVDGWVCVVV